MKNKTIYQLVSLVMALVMILGSTIQTQAAPAAQTTGPSIYWGALVDGKVDMVVGMTSSVPSQPANAWISSSTMPSARLASNRRARCVRAAAWPSP